MGESKPGSKVGAREITNNGFEVYSNGWSDVGVQKVHQDHLRNPVITHTDGKIKHIHNSVTDTGVVTTQGNNFPSIITPVGTTVSTSDHQPLKVDEHLGIVQPEATGPIYKMAPLGNLYWWCKPNFNGNSGTSYHGRPNDIGINNYSKSSDAGMGQQHFINPIGRNGKVPDGKQEPTVTTTDVQASFNLLGKDATVIVAPKQGHVPPPMVSRAEILLPTMDSREAARIFGSLSTFPVVAHVPAIDSREAAWKYRGQMIELKYQGE